MLKIIYVAICVLNVLMWLELLYKAKREIKENNLHCVNHLSMIEKFIAIVKFLIFVFTPILHLMVFFAELVSLHTEAGLDTYLDNVLEDYE